MSRRAGAWPLVDGIRTTAEGEAGMNLTEEDRLEMLKIIERIGEHLAALNKSNAEISRLLDVSIPLTDADRARLKELQSK
jgi:hypothetical protein